MSRKKKPEDPPLFNEEGRIQHKIDTEKYLDAREEAIAQSEAEQIKSGGAPTVIFAGPCRSRERLIESITTFVEKNIPSENAYAHNPYFHSGHIVPLDHDSRRYEIWASVGKWGECQIGWINISADGESQLEFKVGTSGSGIFNFMGYDFEVVQVFFTALVGYLESRYGAAKTLPLIQNGLPAITDEIDKRIFDLVENNPDLKDKEIGQEIGLSRQAVNTRRIRLKAVGYRVR
jgi:hypothetical protein